MIFEKHFSILIFTNELSARAVQLFYEFDYGIKCNSFTVSNVKLKLS